MTWGQSPVVRGYSEPSAQTYYDRTETRLEFLMRGSLPMRRTELGSMARSPGDCGRLGRRLRVGRRGYGGRLALARPTGVGRHRRRRPVAARPDGIGRG